MGVRPISRCVIDARVTSAVATFAPLAGAAFQPAAWAALLTALPPCPCTPTPRVRVDQIAPLLEAGVVRTDDIRPGPHECGDAFLLNDGRFIFHPPITNSLTPTPPLHLPSPRFICEMMRGAVVAVKSDFRSFFFQLEVPKIARSIFRFAAIGDDGAAVTLALSRIPMGWGGSPAAADATARTIADVPLSEDWHDASAAVAAVYIDDVLFRCLRRAGRMKSRAEACGAELKFFTTTTAGVVTYTGIDISIPGGHFRPARSLADRMLTTLGDAEAGRTVAGDVPRLVGYVVGFLERAGVCLAHAAGLIDRLRSTIAPDRLEADEADQGVAAQSPGPPPWPPGTFSGVSSRGGDPALPQPAQSVAAQSPGSPFGLPEALSGVPRQVGGPPPRPARAVAAQSPGPPPRAEGTPGVSPQSHDTLRRGRFRWSGQLAAEAAALRAFAADTAWRSPITPPQVLYGACDASSTGWGWVWFTHPKPCSGSGGFNSSPLHINHLELLAVLRAVRCAPPHSQLRLWVDNACVVQWIRKGLSRTRFASSILLKIEATLHAQGSTLVAAHIPTHLNPADPLSRGERATPAAAVLPPWTPEWQRRVLGWSAPTAPPTASPGPAPTDDGFTPPPIEDDDDLFATDEPPEPPPATAWPDE